MSLIPPLFTYGALQALVEYFQSQSLITPLLLSACASLSCHVPLCWALVLKSGLRHPEAALALGISYWMIVIFDLVLYMRCSPACERTRVPISLELFRGLGEFALFSIPSTVMVWYNLCLLFSKQIFVFQSPDSTLNFVLLRVINLALNGGHMSCSLLSGLLPSPEFESSVLSVWYFLYYHGFLYKKGFKSLFV